jgi:hypothetical protein
MLENTLLILETCWGTHLELDRNTMESCWGIGENPRNPASPNPLQKEKKEALGCILHHLIG